MKSMEKQTTESSSVKIVSEIKKVQEVETSPDTKRDSMEDIANDLVKGDDKSGNDEEDSQGSVTVTITPDFKTEDQSKEEKEDSEDDSSSSSSGSTSRSGSVDEGRASKKEGSYDITTSDEPSQSSKEGGQTEEDAQTYSVWI